MNANHPADMDFRFREDTKPQKAHNNGHVVHRLELHVDGESNISDAEDFYGEEVGYINVTYVPSDVWRKRYTGDWGMVRWLEDFTLYKGSLQTVYCLSKHFDRRQNQLSKNEVEKMSEEAFEQALKHYADKIRNDHKEDYKSSKEFHVNKPRVEFIRVSKDHRRNGYGTALYKRMTEKLDRRFGLSLYDGGLQSDEAEAVWEKLVTLDWNDAREVSYPGDDRGRTRYELSMNPETKQAA